MRNIFSLFLFGDILPKLTFSSKIKRNGALGHYSVGTREKADFTLGASVSL